MTISAHHAALTVADLDRAQAWYGLALGFELQLDFELPNGIRGAMLSTPGGARIELFEVPGAGEGLSWADPPTAMQRRGFGHVAFECAELDAAYGRAIEAGGRSVWAPRQSPEPGRRMAFIHDPEGNLIELIGPVQ